MEEKRREPREAVSETVNDGDALILGGRLPAAASPLLANHDEYLWIRGVACVAPGHQVTAQ